MTWRRILLWTLLVGQLFATALFVFVVVTEAGGIGRGSGLATFARFGWFIEAYWWVGFVLLYVALPIAIAAYAAFDTGLSTWKRLLWIAAILVAGLIAAPIYCLTALRRLAKARNVSPAPAATTVAPAITTTRSDIEEIPSPDGKFVARTTASEWFNSHWVFSPQIVDRQTSEVMFSPETNWSVEPPTPTWIGPAMVRLTMRKYPGNHEPTSLDVIVDCETRSFEITPGGSGALADLEARMDAALSWITR